MCMCFYALYFYCLGLSRRCRGSVPSIVWGLCFEPQCTAASQRPQNCFMLRPCIANSVEDKEWHSQPLHCPYYINRYKKVPKKCILPRMQREGCIGSLIQQLGYVNKQFLLYKEMIWQKNRGDKIEFPLTGCGSRWGLLIFITGTLLRPSQLGTERNQRQLKENSKVTLTMGLHKKVVFSYSRCINVTVFMDGFAMTLLPISF